MKKVIYVLMFLAFAGLSNGQWIPLSNGMNPGTNVKSLAMNSNYIFAGVSNYGIYRSTNGGVLWGLTSMPTLYVYSIVISGSNLIAGTQANGVYRSTDNGFTFTQVYANGMEVPLGVSGNNIFAGNLLPLGGVYISTNNGTNWTQIFQYNQAVKCIATNGSNIFIGTYANGVYRSTNNGNTWTQTSLNNQDVRSLAINGNTVFAGTNPNGVFLSTDNGSSWTQTSLNNERINGLITYNNNVFAGGNNGNVYQSTNNGAIWITRNEGGPGGPNSFLIVPGYIWAGGGQGVYGRNLSEMIGIKNINSEIPDKYSLSQNYPNPFNPSTNIKFQVKSSGVVKLVVFDILGKEITTLVNEKLQPGTYETSFDASKLPSGIYFYRLNAGDFSETKKMTLIK